uniref:Uncharacterized protein n=1 Tax=Panagrolaimus davidi TaxID=227884 RepID=A0A914QK89_9BILA
MIFDIAYENRPIPYREILERFEAVKKNGDVPEYVKEYHIEYYFRVILDSLAYCGIIERKADNPELIKFFPTPSFNLIKKQIQSCDME